MGKKAVHDEVLELLPWFINESLKEKERDLVLTHLRACNLCRLERDRLQAIERLVVEDDLIVPDYRFSFQKVLARINDAERNRESTAELDVSGSARNWLPVAGVAASLLVALIFVAGVQPGVEPAEFKTLSTTVQTNGSLQRIELTFAHPIQAQTMRKALIETQSNIISGPDDAGTYVVEMTLPEAMDQEAFIQSIQAIEGVQFARLSNQQ